MFKRFMPSIVREVYCKTNFRKINLRPCNCELLVSRRSSEPVIIRHFNVCFPLQAKGKNIKKDKKKSSYIDENELSEWLDSEKLFQDFNLAIENFKNDLITHTLLRSTPGAIENIKIEFEGNTYTIQDVAEIGKKSPKLFLLDMSSFPQMIPTVMNALQKSNLNINVQQDGTKIFIPIPLVTKEHREVLAKKAKVFFIKCKDKIRETQIKYIKKLKNAESISDETIIRISNQLVALADKHIKSAEEILKAKENELLKNE